ncbi:hypothetical protein BU23DRAFT_547766 [Bimuria novae-zelandiae CBS 107.79]|uniref:Ubiquitin-like domain-containing protein n=1 Tax=Bimuria novae-zelandiae CBS 107.79 TaxID=1447943 RepID=A0A6A5UIN7_9PLEO|nr:hypothetical protein BU23DRAFT_547766 [Bimuria novae-zelandiae CBS 107.79]
MSFGLSISDCFLLINGLRKLTVLLRGEATDGFRRYENMYYQLAGVAETLSQFAEEVSSQGQDMRFAIEIRNIRRILKKFFSSIQQLKPHLGRKRRRRSLLGAIEKIKWPIHSEKLSQLYQDLMSQVAIITLLNQFHTGSIRPIAATGGLISTSCFYFEDARRELRTINFVSISSWKDLHEFLLRVFPGGDPGHEMIRRQRYLIHKSDPDISILCSSPRIKPFRDIVMNHERVRMSIIFEYQESYEWKCPKCATERSAEFRGVALACDNCDLLLHFQDSHDNRPDPLTEIALRDLRADGMRKFVQDFISEESLARGHSAPDIDEIGLQLGDWIHDRLTNFEPGPTLSRQPQIRNFRMVTVCRSQWPNLSHHISYQDAIKHISKTMEGVKRAIQHLKNEDFPLAQFAALLNSRFWNARANQGRLRFLQSMLQAYESRKPLVWSRTISRLLRDYIQRVDEAGAQFRTSVLRIRCVLWICWDVLRVQAGLFLRCSNLLDLFALPEGYERQKTPLALKLFAMPHTVLLMIPWRLTFDLMEDAAKLFAEERPLYLVSSIQQFLMRPGAIALDFYLDRDLSHYFNTYKLRDDGVGGNFPPTCRRWMEDVMRSEGQSLDTVQVVQPLLEIIEEGYT